MDQLLVVIFELGLWQFAFWWTAVLAIAAWLWVLFADERRKLWHDKHIAWLTWHWFTGGDLDSDRSLPHEGPLAPYLATRYALGLARTTCVAGFLASIYVTTTPAASPRQILVAGYGGAAALAAITLLVAHLAVRGALSMWWAHPLHDAIYNYCGWDEDMKPRHYLDFDRVHELGLALTVQCHPNVKMSDSNVANIVDAVQKKMGRDIEHVPDWVGRASELVFRPPVLIPDRVPFWSADPDEATNVRRLVETSGGSKVLLGLAKDEVPVWMDLDSDSPHFLISAGTGGGKTETLAGIAAQLYWWGAEVCILDLKRLSHIWARDLPGATIESDADRIHDGFVALATVLEDRTRQCDHLRVGDPIPDFQRIVIVTEELNSLFDELTMQWRAQHKTGTSPAVVALRKILYMGRYLKIHIVAGAQRFDANPTGGGAARENYAWRMLAEHTDSARKMLAADADVTPKTSEDRKGRAQLVNGANVTELRRIHWGFDPRDPYYHGPQIVDWLTTSPHTTANCPPHNVSFRTPQAPGPRVAVSGEDSVSVMEICAADVVAATDDGVSYVTLREASADEGRGVVPRSLRTLERASQRPGFPAVAVRGSGPRGNKYSERALVKWFSERKRAPENRADYKPVVYAIVGGGRAYRGGQVKIGYTHRPVGERAKELGNRAEDVVKLVPVSPVAGKALPDKAFHRRFQQWAVHPHDATSELFWIDGDVAVWLGVAS